MKIFLSTDMEGTAGVVDWEQCVGDSPEAAAGRKLLLAEVNAAIEGAVEGGDRGRAQRLALQHAELPG
jgi:D-amino peptidase